MEGVLWVRQARGKLLHGWHKRYYVLTDAGVLREYVSEPSTTAPSRGRRGSSSPSPPIASSSTASSGMTLRRELDVRSAAVKTLPFPLAGRHNAFQLTTVGTDGTRLVLSARQAEDMRCWLTALRTVRSRLASASNARESTSSSSSTSLSMIERLSSDSVSGMENEDFLEVAMPQRDDMAQLSSVYEWVHDCAVKTSRSLRVAGTLVPRGSLLVSANGVSLQTLQPAEVRQLLLEAQTALPVALRFLRSPQRRGVLRAKLCASPLTQLKSMARYRTTPMLQNWKEQVVELSGDLLMCQLKPKTSKANSSGNSRQSGGLTRARSSSGSNSGSGKKRVLVLSAECSVKPVHELVAERKFCFLVSVQAHAMLFQARSEADRRAWTSAIQRAITIAEGLVPGGALARGSFDLEALQTQSSLNMRHLEHQFDGLEGLDSDSSSSNSDVEEAGANEDEQVDEERAATAVPSLPPKEHWVSATQSAAYLPDTELSEMLGFLQMGGRFVEALQLMGKNTTLRATYWRHVFRWAMTPTTISTSTSGSGQMPSFEQLAFAQLSDADNVQVQKDIPRTAKWLAGSAGAPKLDAASSAERLEHLERVLRAFLASCSLDVRTDQDPLSPSASRSSVTSFYMQGMNGLAFILLEVLGDAEEEAFRFLRGLVARILPHVFGICCDGTGRDHFDLFRSLVEVGDVLQEVARLHLPNLDAALDRAGLPVCLLAYKWFPTLFSDVSLTASHAQLRYDTLLGCWDVCMLLGLEGMFCVALALCSAAEDAVLALSDEASASAEQVSCTIGRALSRLSPEDLITSVCEVLELCSHPVLLKLRNAHRRRLQLGYSKVGNGFAPTGTTQPLSGDDATTPPMTVTDLDSGKVFKISRSGGMLLPAPKSEQQAR